MITAKEILGRRCAVVVAHPDDEIVWFSSVLSKVEKIVICFRDLPGSTVGVRRQAAIDRYPLKNVDWLCLPEPNSLGAINWSTAAPNTPFHFRGRKRRTRIEATKMALRQRFATALAGFEIIFTHNPWGEYGHEDHIIVHDAAAAVAAEQDASVWFDNYASSRTIAYMNGLIDGIDDDYICLPSDHELAAEIRNIYVEARCWTWWPDYRWFREECFMQQPKRGALGNRGHIFPINYVRTDNFPKNMNAWTWTLPRAYHARRRKLLRWIGEATGRRV